jgi:hypothetical protein
MANIHPVDRWPARPDTVNDCDMREVNRMRSARGDIAKAAG